MATIKNERDIQLQATSPRLLAVSTNYISIVPSTNTFTTTSSGVVPTSISVKAFKNGILAGTILWNVSPSTTYSTITDGISINGTDIPIGTSITITASLTYLGVAYSASTVLTRAANSSIITLEQTAANVNKSSLGVFTPVSVVFSGKVADGANTPAAYAGRFVVDNTNDGTTYSNLYTSSINESSYTYTPSASHKAVRVKLYAAGGTVTLLAEKNTTISESGTIGADGSIIYITPSSYVTAKNQNNVFSPATITFSAKTKTGSAPATSYLGRFRIYENGSITASYTSVANESSTIYSPSVGCTSIKCELYLAGGLTTKIDEQGITVSLSGANAISAVLTNEAHVLPSDSAGNITSYAGSGTQLYVYEGGTQIPYDEAGYTLGNSNTWKVTTTVSNIAVGTKTDGGTYADFSTVSGVASGVDLSSITFNILGITSIGLPFTATKIQRFAKSKEGLQGPAGPSDTTNLLKLNAANILTGTVVPQDTGGLKTGSITWNSVTGALTGGTGVAMTEWGIIGASSGVATFTLETTTGAATFKGNITGGANINITGASIFTGSSIGPSGRHAAVIANDGGVEQYGIVGYATNIFQSTGVLGDASTKTNARGVSGIATTGGSVGVYCSNSAGTALYVDGPMAITNATVVSNLNADMVDGRHASSLCQIVVTNSGTCIVAGSGFNLVSTVSGVRTRSTGSNDIVIEPFSDRTLKNNILPEELGLEFINKLIPCTYGVNHLPGYTYHGFIHQDVKPLLDKNDGLAPTHEDGIGGFDYNGISSPIVKAIQELHQEVLQLKERIRILENK